MDSHNNIPPPPSTQGSAVPDSTRPGTTGKGSDRLRINPEGTLIRSDWYALRLFNQYRFFLLLAFAVTFYLAESFQVLGSRHTGLFQFTHLVWMVLAVVFTTTIKLRKPTLEVQFYLQQYIDILAISTLMYASGGVSSQLGVLLLVNIAIIANFARARYTILFAAIAMTIVLVAELIAGWLIGSWAIQLADTAMLGVALFAVALVTSLLIHHYSAPEQNTTITELSAGQLQELREQIVEEIDSGVLHLDSRDQVQLINTQASIQLGLTSLTTPQPLQQLCEPLWESLQQWRVEPANGVVALSHPTISHEVLPHFVKLSDNSLLIRLEDQADINQKLQQLKQASLGRMSSSIAHEIRNPLGAIANAVQLLGESEKLDTEDHELVTIAYKHTQRINRIIEDVMQLSARSNLNTENIQLHAFLNNLAERFTEQNNLAPGTLTIAMQSDPHIGFDAHHLDQIIWNLCSNSVLHNTADKPEVYIHVYSEDGMQPIIDISDNGPGIKTSDMDKIFEPFFTTRSGTGLGLCICRELCSLNSASLACIPVSHGSCFRIQLSATGNRYDSLNTFDSRSTPGDEWDWKKAA